MPKFLNDFGANKILLRILADFEHSFGEIFFFNTP